MLTLLDKLQNGEELHPFEWTKLENGYKPECENYRTCNSCRRYARVKFMDQRTRDLCELIGIGDYDCAEINHRGTCKKWRFRPGTWPNK